MKKILFYCSWGGYGHIARAYSVAKFIDFAEVVVASPQKWIFPQDDNIRFIELPKPMSRYRFEGEKIVLQNYNKTDDSEGYKNHLFTYFKLLETEKPDLVIVDNPAEIAILTKMLGFKTCIVWETLDTNDLRWRLAWGNVDKVLVPYIKEFADDLNFDYHKNAFFSGGFTRFEDEVILEKDTERAKLHIDKNKRAILLAVGMGRSSQDVISSIIHQLASDPTNIVLFPFYIKDKWSLGLENKYPNLRIVYGQTDIKPYVCSADIVITGAGYNSMMEAFSYKKPTILVPLDRVYNEQLNKAVTAKKLNAAFVLDIKKKDWSKTLSKLISETSDSGKISEMITAQKKIVDGSGAKRTAKFIKGLL